MDDLHVMILNLLVTEPGSSLLSCVTSLVHVNVHFELKTLNHRLPFPQTPIELEKLLTAINYGRVWLLVNQAAITLTQTH